MPADLIRLSVGIETADDLLADLDAALSWLRRRAAPVEPVAVCVDFGSTFTKASLVDLRAGRIVARAEHPTTIDTDLLDGYDACLAELTRADPRAAEAEVLACSSAGGGLRIAVIGNEELVTAEAGRRVALSSGGRVVSVQAVAGGVGLQQLDDPDVVLLTGGTDGGNAEVLTAAARQLVAGGWTGPVVVAGNVDARDEVAVALDGVPHVLADNVMPRIGVLAPESARSAIREMFLAHVIGGKHLSARADFTTMVRGATPDVVLTGVEVLARAVGDVVVVDVGGATTDVHSVVKLDPEDAGLSREVVATTPVTRTVEGDLGMRWSAVATAAAAEPRRPARGRRAARRRPGLRAQHRPGARGGRAARPGRGRPRAAAARRPVPRGGQPGGPGGRAQRQGPARGAPARRIGRRAAARARRASASGCWARAPAPTSRAAGSCPRTRRWWSTPTTCSPRSGCSPR